MFDQNIAGNWQGTVKFGNVESRIVISIAQDANNGWTASEVTRNDGVQSIAASSVSFQGSPLKIAFGAIHATYEGVMSEDQKSLNGTWTQGSPVPLDLERATVESSWRGDRTPHKIHCIEVDDSVRLEVVDWGGSGRAGASRIGVSSGSISKTALTMIRG